MSFSAKRYVSLFSLHQSCEGTRDVNTPLMVGAGFEIDGNGLVVASSNKGNWTTETATQWTNISFAQTGAKTLIIGHKLERSARQTFHDGENDANWPFTSNSPVDPQWATSVRRDSVESEEKSRRD
jgi:hypothetical protein